MFDWDERKAARNIEKHGVTFEETMSCLADPGIVMGYDLSHSKSRGEARYIGIAKSDRGRILTFVITVRRTRNGQEIFRIISSRHASKKERQSYPRS